MALVVGRQGKASFKPRAPGKAARTKGATSWRPRASSCRATSHQGSRTANCGASWITTNRCFRTTSPRHSHKASGAASWITRGKKIRTTNPRHSRTGIAARARRCYLDNKGKMLPNHEPPAKPHGQRALLARLQGDAVAVLRGPVIAAKARALGSY